MFIRKGGQVLHPEHVTKRFARLVREAGWPPASRSRSSPSRWGMPAPSITANLYQHVLPSMDERTANAVARLILGDRRSDAESSAVNPLSTGPQVHEATGGGDA